MLVPRARAALLLAALLSLAPGPASGEGLDSRAAADLRRVLTLLNVTAEEYREGVVDGKVVLPVEYGEAEAFLAEAEARLRSASPAAAAAGATAFAAAAAGIRNKAPLAQIRADLGAVRTAITEATGVVEEVYPSTPPAAERGQALFDQNCAACHGAKGDGAGPNAAALPRPPADLTAPGFMRRETPFSLFNVIGAGMQATGMPAWAEVLSLQERWDVVSYLYALETTPARLDDGRRLYLSECAGCHGATGVAGGTARNPPPPLDDLAALARRTDAELFAAVAHGVPDSAMPGFAGRFPEPDLWAVVSYVRALSLNGTDGSAPADGGRSDVAEQLAQVRRLLAEALAAYRSNTGRAAFLVSDAYLLFDPMEKALALRDADLTRRAEALFGELRGVVSTPGNEGQATRLVAALESDLDAAQAALAPRTATAGVAVQAALIILREGFEAVLIVGALLAYVRKIGQRAMRRPILWGAAAGLVSSMLTAYALAQLTRAAGATAEVIEGATMLLAAAVLFFVSYWLVSKAEAERWQRYIQGKVKRALAAGNAAALGAAAFLAVYREGVETVLFFMALVDSAAGALAPAAAGFAAGLLGLAIFCALYLRLGTQVPLRQFFLATGGMLYYLAVVFAGKGVAELQGAGLIDTTPVPWVPRIDAIGLIPSAETLAAQAVLLLGAFYALVVTIRRARRDTADAVSAGVSPQRRASV